MRRNSPAAGSGLSAAARNRIVSNVNSANTSLAANVFPDMADVGRLSALARLAADGDDQSWEALIRALWPNAYRIAWSILGDHGAAEHAAQSACVAISAKLSTLVDTRAFIGWAYRIVVSHARDHARARSRRRRHETTSCDAAKLKTTFDDPSSRLDLESAIGGLPESLRLCLELYYFVGLTSREVGIALGVPAATVRFRLMIARRRLRPLLDERSASTVTPEVAS